MTGSAGPGVRARYCAPVQPRRDRSRRRVSRSLAGVLVAGTALSVSLGLGGCGGSGGGDDAATVGPAVALQDDRLPVARPDELSARIDMFVETGAKVARVDLFWSDIAPEPPADATDPADPAYDWSKADAILTAYAQEGIDSIVSVYNTPAWAAGGQGPPEGTIINNNFPDPNAYGEFMAAVARRYSGDFQPEGADSPLPEVAHLEIWNEPNFRSFLGPQVDASGNRVAADAYAKMAESAYPLIKRANPDATVIVGVGGPRGASGEGATGAREWLELLREKDIPLDAYSQHIYPAAAPDVETVAFPSWSSIDGFLSELDEWKPDLDLYITEAGYTTAATPYRKVHVTDAQQAEYLEEIFALPQVNQERVAAIVWFNMQDNEFWPAGLLREDASEKPSYDVFKRVVEERENLTLPGPG